MKNKGSSQPASVKSDYSLNLLVVRTIHGFCGIYKQKAKTLAGFQDLLICS